MSLAAGEDVDVHESTFIYLSFSYFFKKVLQKHKHIKPCMLSIALALASIALNISHARLR